MNNINTKSQVVWTAREDSQLRSLYNSNGPDWMLAAANLPGKTIEQCRIRGNKLFSLATQPQERRELSNVKYNPSDLQQQQESAKLREIIIKIEKNVI